MSEELQESIQERGKWLESWGLFFPPCPILANEGTVNPHETWEDVNRSLACSTEKKAFTCTQGTNRLTKTKKVMCRDAPWIIKRKQLSMLAKVEIDKTMQYRTNNVIRHLTKSNVYAAFSISLNNQRSDGRCTLCSLLTVKTICPGSQRSTSLEQSTPINHINKHRQIILYC